MLRTSFMSFAIALTIFSCCGARAQMPTAPNAPPPAQIRKQTLAGIDKLQTWYTQSTGLYQTTGWWNSANVLTMLAVVLGWVVFRADSFGTALRMYQGMAWLRGTGAAAIFNLMEDAATAEISRSQVWQWIHHHATLSDGRTITRQLVVELEEGPRLVGSLAGIELSELRLDLPVVVELERPRQRLAELRIVIDD